MPRAAGGKFFAWALGCRTGSTARSAVCATARSARSAGGHAGGARRVPAREPSPECHLPRQPAASSGRALLCATAALPWTAYAPRRADPSQSPVSFLVPSTFKLQPHLSSGAGGTCERRRAVPSVSGAQHSGQRAIQPDKPPSPTIVATPACSVERIGAGCQDPAEARGLRRGRGCGPAKMAAARM